MKYFDVMDGDKWVFTGTYKEIAKKFNVSFNYLKICFSKEITFRKHFRLYQAEMVGKTKKKKKVKAKVKEKKLVVKNYKYKEYAVYKGEEFLEVGTVKELALKFNVAEKTVRYWIAPANRRKDKGKRKIAILLEGEE